VLTGNAKGVVSSTHSLCVGSALVIPRIQDEIEQSDVVLVAGSELSDADLYNGGRALQFTGKVIRIDNLDRIYKTRTYLNPNVGRGT
jgi:acetolactate synthase-1/2/3 large subunit